MTNIHFLKPLLICYCDIVWCFSKMAVENMSRSVYEAMCDEIGTPQLVKYLRDRREILELVWNKVVKIEQLKIMMSGSVREGFRYKHCASDVDQMIWQTNQRVIWDLFQSQFYDTYENGLILCDNSESRPGYTLLQLPVESASPEALSVCIRMKRGLYISSSKYREIMLSSHSFGSTIHGPCCSGTILNVEFDNAICFASDFWPPSAFSWIDRCNSWPPSDVVNDIVENGCHFVAIGNKQGEFTDNEWRISFSQAEYKLVYSMNHLQFLTYGLLKIVLKEIINKGLKEEEKLLCSYHIKTVIFWAIQENTLQNALHWCPQNLLANFWLCFKLLLKWVYDGACPNFFIPQNNMFLNNIHGEAQQSLFAQLYGLYEKGISLLLQSPSIRPYMVDVLCNPRLTVFTDEDILISEAELDEEYFSIVIQFFDELSSSDIRQCMNALNKDQLTGSSMSHYQVVMVQKCLVSFLQYVAFVLHNTYSIQRANKKMYTAYKMFCHILKLADKMGYVYLP